MAVVLVVGGGGREHAMVAGLVRGDSVAKVYAGPGNPGMARENKTECVVIDVTDHTAVVLFCREHKVDLVAVGPEAPLAAGIADSLTEAGIKVFGPRKSAAKLEADKSYAKEFMQRHNIPTARAQSFHTPQEAKDFIKESDWSGWAVKVSGLAGGKGVVVSSDRHVAMNAVDTLTTAHAMAATTLLVEERLHGTEISAMCFTDGTTLVAMPPAQDHKARFEGNSGPNTGGMGAVCPYPITERTRKLCQEILDKTLQGLIKDKCIYKGVLYAGLMLVDEQPYVLEYNCRFGDPETEAVLPLLQSDLYVVMNACASGNLGCVNVRFSTDTAACAVVVVTRGYPENAEKGLPITGLDDVSAEGESGCTVKAYQSGTATKDSTVNTNGGRVITVTATAPSLSQARSLALRNAKKITFEGASIREDIGLQAVKVKGEAGNYTYSQAGVSVLAGDSFINTIRDSVASTHGPLVLEGIGGFGALFDVHGVGMKRPVLVAGTDGVGTKLMVANEVGRHDTIGQDLVAMCVNDILCHGARPLFFLDYLATGKLESDVLEHVVKGIAAACRETGTALVGGETAEMPGMYKAGDYDVAGFIVGAVERPQLLPRRDAMAAGDCVIGLASSGMHSNGYSLVRKIVEDLGLSFSGQCPFDNSRKLGDVLLTPTRLYVDAFAKIQDKVLGATHITGGGIIGNAGRCLPDHLAVKLDITKWLIPKEFLWIAGQGVSPSEMAKTFNLGLGMIFIVRQRDKAVVMDRLEKDEAFEIGQLVTRAEDRAVEITNLDREIVRQQIPCSVSRPRIKTAILISGRGSNMQAIVERARCGSSPVDVVMVLSNKPDAEGLKWADQFGIPTACVNHREYPDRLSFECAVHELLLRHKVQLVCLAGFMRILTHDFVAKWKNRLINIHPSILPAFKGKDAQKQALEAKVKITGCTVHFVETEVDSGAIIAQDSVPVMDGDTVDCLSERIRGAEHTIFPSAVMAVASDMLTDRSFC